MILDNEKLRLANAVSSQLIRDYGLECSAEVVVFGINITLRVKTSVGNEYYVKIYRKNGKSKSDIESEVLSLNLIQDDSSVNISRPIKNEYKSYVSTVDCAGYEGRFLVVFTAVDGRNVECNPSDFSILGRALNTIHHQDQARVRRRIDLPNVSSIYRRLKEIVDIPNNESFIIAELLLLSAAEFDISRDREVLLHGDIHKTNLRIKDNRLGVFDFDDGGLGSIYYDISSVVIWIEDDALTDAATTWAAFLCSYNLDRSELIRSHIGYFASIRQIQSLLFLCENKLIRGRTVSDVANSVREFLEKCAAMSLKIDG